MEHSPETENLSANKTSLKVILMAVLALSALAVFWRVTHFQFLNFHDPEYVTRNLQVQKGLSLENINWSFHATEPGGWQPLVWLSHMLDCQLFGVQPAGHHFTNLFLHIANSLLLFGLLRKITGAVYRSFFVAALFAFHPLQIESVAWISARKELLGVFFGLLTIWAYARFAQSKVERREDQAFDLRPSTFAYVLSLVFFVLGLMSQPLLLVLPAAFLLLDFWLIRRLDPDEKFPLVALLKEKIPFLALSAVSGIATLLIAQKTIPSAEVINVSWFSRMGHGILAAFAYFTKMLWPMNLATPNLYETHFSWLEVFGAFLILGGLTFGAISLARNRPYLAFGWFWFLIAIMPVVFASEINLQAASDRYAYFSIIGILVMIIWGIWDLLKRLPQREIILGVAGSVFLFVTIAITSFQLRYWKKSESLFQEAIRVVPHNYRAEKLLGDALAGQGKLDAAAQHYAKALKIKSSWKPAETALQTVIAQGAKTDVRADGKPADEKEMAQGFMHGSAGFSLAQVGRYAEAEAHYLELLRVAPNDSEAHSHLADVLYQQGKLADAAFHFSEAVRLNPRDLSSRKTLALCLGGLGKTDEAAAQFAELIRLKPSDPAVHYYFGLALVIQGKRAEAVEHFRNAIRLNPDWPVPLNDLAWILATHPKAEVRDGPLAVEMAERACALSDGHTAYFFGTLDAAYAEAGRFDDAIATAQKTYEMGKKMGSTDIAEAALERVKLYRAKKPYRQP